MGRRGEDRLGDRFDDRLELRPDFEDRRDDFLEKRREECRDLERRDLDGELESRSCFFDFFDLFEFFDFFEFERLLSGLLARRLRESRCPGSDW